MAKNRFDFIVIGAGSAGCVVANRLSEDPDSSVLVIEAGGPDSWWDFRIQMPAALTFPLNGKRYNWQFLTEPVPALNGRQLQYFRGKVLGGSSTINGMVYVRGHPKDFDSWAQDPELSQWSYRHCLPYFRRSESYDQGGDDFRGDSGPLHVQKGFGRSPLYEVFVEAALEAGYPFSSDMNGFRQEGFGRMDMTIHKGVRESTARAFLHPAMRRRNLAVVTGAVTSRILVEGGRAVGVEYLSGGKLRRVRADREVVLCAGAIQSPQILMLSGIGDADQLRRHGIPVVCDLPGVGQNLGDHVEYIVSYECTKPVSYYYATKSHNQLRIGAEWQFLKSGLGTSNFFEAGGFFKTTEREASPDVQVHFVALAAEYSGRAASSGDSYQVHLSPHLKVSRGSVTLRSADPREHPVIQPNWLTDPSEWETSRLAILKSRDILEQKPFAAYRGREMKPGPDRLDRASLDAFIRENAETGYHFAGTCKMGGDEMSVVDGMLKVRGIDGLRVADASVMPTVTNGNTNAPTIMIGERAADFIRGRHLSPSDVRYHGSDPAALS